MEQRNMSWYYSVLLLLLLYTVFTNGNDESTCSKEMERFAQDIRGKISRLEDDNRLLHRMNSDQDKLIKAQMEKLEQLQRELMKADEKTSLKDNRQEVYLSENDFLKSPYGDMIQGFNHLRQSMKSPSMQNRQVSSGVSFYAYLSTNVNGLSQNTGIIFDRVVTNEGDGYQNASGVFVVPETGIYVFMWSLTGRNGNIPMQLTVNGVPRSWLDPYTGSHDATNTASGFILLRVTSGDKVLIRTHPTFLPKGYIESDTWIQSGFGGWVLGYD